MTLSGFKEWDSFGANDNDRVKAVNEYHKNHGGKPLDAVWFPQRVIHHSVPFKLYSGMALMAAKPPREYARATTLVWDGPAGSSQFVFLRDGEKQTNQSYPSDGSPRDGTFSNILFQGGEQTHCIEYFDVHSNAYTGHTLWYWLFDNCGWRYQRTAWNGWGTGCVLSGIPHFQGLGAEALAVGGSENRIFGAGYGLLDAQPSLRKVPGAPALHCHSARTLISDVMLSVRGDGYGLLIDYGNNIYVDGLSVDSPNSDPQFGASVKIKGGKNIHLAGLSLKGSMHNPGAATGGNNRGVIDISGGEWIVLDGINALKEGTNAPTNTPVVYVGAGAKKVLIKSVNCFGYDGVVKVEAGADVKVEDPRLKVVQA
jgi:hypothetical protein